MKLSSVDSKILVALGLMAAAAGPGCTTSSCLDVAGPGDTSTSACLDVAPPTESGASQTDDGTGEDSTGTGGSSGGGEASTGPCLSPPQDSGDDFGTTGGDSTGTGGSTGGDSTGGSDSGGAAASEDPTARVLDSGVLPPDVVERLRKR